MFYKKTIPLFFAAFFFISQYAAAQEKSNIKFGKVSAEDFNLPPSANSDTSSAAVIVADIGSTEFEGNRKGWFTLVHKRFTRIKILKQTGAEAADFYITMYEDENDKEKLEDVKAVTYNLDNGKVVETKLDSKEIFTEKKDKNHFVKKFALPAVKEGSIIEVSYTILSDFTFNLRSWYFQSIKYPTLWSEYKVNMPDMTRYMILKQGRHPFHINNQKVDVEVYTIWQRSQGDVKVSGISEKIKVNATVTKFQWVMKDVPALKQEKFAASPWNFISMLDFQLAQIDYGDGKPVSIMDTWPNAVDKLLVREDFGQQLTNTAGIISDIVTSVVNKTDTELEKTRKLFEFVRDNFVCTNHSSMWLNSVLRNVAKNKQGNVAELNLLLVSLLKFENILASPVLLSTRDNAVVNPQYPILNKFNYVICHVKMGEDTYYLDASRPMLAFGKLPLDCYNGPVKIINNNYPYAPEFKTDQITEESVTDISITNSGQNEWVGKFQQRPGYYESYDIRREIAEKGESSFFNELKSSLDQAITNERIDSLKQFEKPVSVRYDFTIKNTGENTIYFNAVMMEKMTENPFAAADRIYPVEMPYLSDKTYTLNLQIPTGYVVDELPKSDKFNIGDGQVSYEYKISKDEKTVKLLCRLKVDKNVFSPGEYKALRDFFASVINKENEQIVFKLKK